LNFETIEDTILRIQHRDGKQIVYLAKRTQTPIYEVPENLPLAQGAHIRFTVKRSVLGFKFVGVEEHTPKPPSEASENVPTSVKLSTEAGASKAQEATAQLTMLPIENLSGTLAGLERVGEDPELEELAETARTTGILQPVIAMLAPGTQSVYLVVAGNRRVKAAKKAGLTQVPVIVKPYNLEEAYEISLIENIQRQNLTAYELGRRLKEGLERFPQRYPNQETLGNRLGKEQSWVSKQISAYETAQEMKDALIPRGIKPETLTEFQLRSLHEAKPEERPALLSQLTQEGPLSARDIARAVKDRGVKKPREGPGRKSKEELMREDQDKALKILHDQLGKIFQNVRTELQDFLKLYPSGHETISQYLADEFNSILALLPQKHAQLVRAFMEKGKRA